MSEKLAGGRSTPLQMFSSPTKFVIRTVNAHVIVTADRNMGSESSK